MSMCSLVKTELSQARTGHLVSALLWGALANFRPRPEIGNSFTSDVTKGSMAGLRRQGCRCSRPLSARHDPALSPGVGIRFPLRNQRRLGTFSCWGGDRPLVTVNWANPAFRGSKHCCPSAYPQVAQPARNRYDTVNSAGQLETGRSRLPVGFTVGGSISKGIL
jgi:hypothetical protein